MIGAGAENGMIELQIGMTAGRYQAVLRRDGLVADRRRFATRQLVAAWVRQVKRDAGPKLYVRLQGKGAGTAARLLDLAHRLSLDGIMIGIDLPPDDCRRRARPLQYPCVASPGRRLTPHSEPDRCVSC